MEKLDIKENQRRAVNASLDSVYSKPGDFIEVTEWSNGEGYDVTLATSDKQESFSLHFIEWKILKKLIKHLDEGQ
jgi:hypothetical protein